MDQPDSVGGYGGVCRCVGGGSAATVSVNCNSGQSLNLTLSKMDKHTCGDRLGERNVHRDGAGDRLSGAHTERYSGCDPGAAEHSEQQHFNAVLYIEDSQSVRSTG